jgi:hypothetical protein
MLKLVVNIFKNSPNAVLMVVDDPHFKKWPFKKTQNMPHATHTPQGCPQWPLIYIEYLLSYYLIKNFTLIFCCMT